MSYATTTDVAIRLRRELTVDEIPFVTELLEDVEALIKLRIPDLDARVDSGSLPERVIVMVEVNAVVRLITNPEAFIEEVDGNYSYRRSEEGVAGYLTILDVEWGWLGDAGGMFQLVPVSPNRLAPYEGYARQPDAHTWNPPSYGWAIRVP